MLITAIQTHLIKRKICDIVYPLHRKTWLLLGVWWGQISGSCISLLQEARQHHSEWRGDWLLQGLQSLFHRRKRQLQKRRNLF